MARCDICAKTVMMGHHRSHSQHATQKFSMPNTVRRTVIVKGEKKKMNICTRCLRTQVKSA